MAGIELKNSSYSAAVGSASSGSSMSASGPGSGSGSTASSVVESIRSAECSTQKTTSARMEFRSSTHGAPELDSEQLTRTSGCWCGALSLPFPATSLPRGRVCEAGRASELPSHPRASLASTAAEVVSTRPKQLPRRTLAVRVRTALLHTGTKLAKHQSDELRPLHFQRTHALGDRKLRVQHLQSLCPRGQ